MAKSENSGKVPHDESCKRIDNAIMLLRQICDNHEQAHRGGTLRLELVLNRDGLASRAIVSEENVF